MYEPLDLQTTQVTLWAAVLFLAAGVVVLLHSRWRQRRYVRLDATGGMGAEDGEDTRYEGADRGFDARREMYAALAMIALGVVAGVFSYVTVNHLEETVDQNVSIKYGTEDVQGNGWRGNALNATVVMPDGTVYEEVLIAFDPQTGEPTIMGDHPGLTEPEESAD